MVRGSDRGAGLTEHTRRAYRGDLADFTRWCATRGTRARVDHGPTVAAYLDDLAPRSAPATVRRRLAALVDAARRAGLASPRDDAVVRAAAARAGWRYRARVRPTTPLRVAELAAMVDALDDGPAGRRDRALLLVGFGAALRRTELVALACGDLVVRRDGGLTVRPARGPVLVPPGSRPSLCAVRAWRAWSTCLADRDPRAGPGAPAFRAVDRHGNVADRALSDRAVTDVVRRAAARAGLDPTAYSGRSLRLGMVLVAAARGVPDEGIVAHTGYTDRRRVREYRAR